MWSHSVKSKSFSGDTLTFIVEFSDGSTRFTKPIRIQDVNQLKSAIRATLAELERKTSTFASVNEGAALDLTEPPPTQAELDARQWLGQYHRLLAVEQAAAAGILSDTEPKIVALRNWVSTNFKPAYIDLI